jgi:hypothetical protein
MMTAKALLGSPPVFHHRCCSAPVELPSPFLPYGFLAFHTRVMHTGRLPLALLILCHGQGRLRQEPSTTWDCWTGSLSHHHQPAFFHFIPNCDSCCTLQVLAIEEMFKHRVTNVVFMGMGEPMLNLKSVLEAHRCFNKVCWQHHSRVPNVIFLPLYITNMSFSTFRNSKLAKGWWQSPQ